MASTIKRRPLPALAALLALLLLTGVVWWRVLNRSNAATSVATPCPTPTAAVTTLPAPDKVVVAVLNSTARQGIAAQARTALLNAGFSVPGPAKNDTRPHLNRITAVAEIRFSPAARSSAQLLGYYLPGAVLVRTPFPSLVVTVSLGKRYTSVAAPAAVARALQRDNTVAGPPAASSSPGC